MIVGIGVDLTEVARIATVWHTHGDRFLERILTPAERADLANRPAPGRLPHLAGRFAAKEAAMKALSHGFGRVRFTELEIRVDALRVPTLAPNLVLHGEAARIAAHRGVRHVHLSISHTERQAMAFVVLES